MTPEVTVGRGLRLKPGTLGYTTLYYNTIRYYYEGYTTLWCTYFQLNKIL